MSAIPLHGIKTRPRRIARAKGVSRDSSQLWRVILTYVFVFAFIVASAYAASSLVGHTLMEQARREGLRASERASMARKDVAALRQKIERLVGLRSVERWAEVRGFAPDGDAKVLVMNRSLRNERSPY